MTTDQVISVENLSKRYLVGHQSARRDGYDTLRDTIVRHARNFGHKTSDLFRGRQLVQGDEVEEFWALKDISFQVKRGEVLGIIGRNGAGKSTLLKILSRVTDPTKGRITISGRVASLLEVGTGFHPELTGRENIFLNGAILGMTKTEIKGKFDEIVEFADVERFLDTPVKRYSSGMYLRLAFAIAAHLQPEILIVDEVLAVGDAEFQKKCLGKMGEVVKDGRTVLFVSHQMAAIQNLCGSVITLAQGTIAFCGDTNQAISVYLAHSTQTQSIPLSSRSDRKGSGAIKFTAVHFRAETNEYRSAFLCGGVMVCELHIENTTGHSLNSVAISIGIDNQHGQRVIYLDTGLVDQNLNAVPAGLMCLEVEIPRLPLGPGRYEFTLHAIANGVVADWIKNAGWFDVEPADFYGTGKLPPFGQGSFLVQHRFQIKLKDRPANVLRLVSQDRI